jgi:hypothetical protein
MKNKLIQITQEAVAELFRDDNLKSVIAFVPRRNDSKYRIKATRVKYKRGNDAREKEIRISIGRLNYAEREFLKLCKKAKCHPRKFWFKSFSK